jgi:hypothetical protein
LARLTPARALLILIAAGALAPAACSKSNSSAPTPVHTAVPTFGPSSTPVPDTEGVAYIPDGGNGGPPGLVVTHFLDNSGDIYHYFPEQVNFGGSVKSFAVASNDSLGMAVTKIPGGDYSGLQGVLGTANTNPIPGGAPYNTAIQPTAAPSASPVPPNATIAAVSSIALLFTGDNSVGLAMGPTAQGILGVNQVSNQAPTFNGFIPYTCNNHTITPSTGRQNIEISSTANGSGVYTALVRGPNDLVSFAVTPNFGVTPPIYVFCVQAQDAALGSHGALEGRGAMAISPAQPGRGIVLQSPTDGAIATLVTNMPSSLQKSSSVAFPDTTRANAVAIHPNGFFAAVGADSGLFVIKGVTSTLITQVNQGSPASNAPYHPSYLGGDGQMHKIQNVTSIGFSNDGTFLGVLCSTTANNPGGGATASFIVLPFNEVSGVISAPVLVDNGLIAPAFFQDFMVMR